MDNEAWGKPRDTGIYPGYQGFVRNVLDQYYHYLNLGLKLPISAGSASGVLKNPVGFNRLYVHLGHEFSYDKWFLGMKAGLAFATNGPILFFSVDNCELSSRLTSPDGSEYQGVCSLRVLSQNELERVEIIHNEEVIWDIDARGLYEVNQEFDISFKKSGWVIARAFEVSDKTIRFAHTNPIYIEIGEPIKPVYSSAMYYLNWCKELLDESLNDKERYVTDIQREEVESLYRSAIKFYENLAFGR